MVVVGRRTARRGWLMLLLSGWLAVLGGSGCGTDGTSGVSFPPEPPATEAEITGTVLAPNGEFAALDRGWNWPLRLGVVAPALALQGVAPAGGILNVALYSISLTDAKDGQINNPKLLKDSRTAGDGIYQIVDYAARDIEQCRLMVAVGVNETLTRAFVASHSTNIDAVSEAVVRIVLHRLTQAPPVQLCDFSNADLTSILDAAAEAAFPARGDSVATINLAACERAARNRDVRLAVEAASGVPVDVPLGGCTRD